MPYIKNQNRPFFDNEIQQLVDKLMEHDIRFNKGELNPGNMNYIVSSILSKIVKNNSCYIVNYDMLNSIVGCLECIKTEFERKVVAPYEERKIQENGDLYNA